MKKILAKMDATWAASTNFWGAFWEVNILNKVIFILGVVLFAVAAFVPNLARPSWDAWPAGLKAMLMIYLFGLYAQAAVHTAWDWLNQLARKEDVKKTCYNIGSMIFAGSIFFVVHDIELFHNHHEVAIWTGLFIVDSVISQGFMPIIEASNRQDETAEQQCAS